MPFDIKTARDQGYSDDEITEFLNEKFDVNKALSQNYTLDDLAANYDIEPLGDFDSWFEANAKVESGGEYNIKGPKLNSGSSKGWSALGKYQIMPNLHFKKFGLDPVKDEQRFLNDPELQEKVARSVYREFWDKAEGDPQKATAYKYGRGDDKEIPTAGGQRMPTGKEHWELVKDTMDEMGASTDKSSTPTSLPRPEFEAPNYQLPKIDPKTIQQAEVGEASIPESPPGVLEAPTSATSKDPLDNMQGIESEKKPSYPQVITGPVQPISDTKKRTSLFESGIQGLASGLDQVGMSLGSIMEYGGEKTDIDALANLGRKIYKIYKERPAIKNGPPEEIKKKVSENPKVMLDPRWWTYNVSQMAPSLAIAMAPGMIAGKVIKVGGTALKMAPKVVGRLVTLGSSLTGGVAGGALEGSSTYQEMKDGGATEKEAQTAAEMMTAMSAGLNAISFSKMLSKAPKGVLKKGMNAMLSGATESITEWLEEPAEVIAKRKATGEIKDIPGTVKDAVQAIKDGLDVVGPSFLLGMIGAAGSIEVEQSTQKTETTQKPVEDIKDLNAPKAVNIDIEEALSKGFTQEEIDQFMTEEEAIKQMGGLIKSKPSTGLTLQEDLNSAFSERVKSDFDQMKVDIPTKNQMQAYWENLTGQKVSREDAQELIKQVYGASPQALLEGDKISGQSEQKPKKKKSKSIVTKQESPEASRDLIRPKKELPKSKTEKLLKESEEITQKLKENTEKLNATTTNRGGKLPERQKSKPKTTEQLLKDSDEITNKIKETTDKIESISPKSRTTVAKEREAPVAKKPGETPSPAQIEAGNYPKKHIRRNGFDISIENPKGSVRSGTDGKGKEWSQTMTHDYGYIKGTKGYDKDHLDVFINPNSKESDREVAYVVNQVNPGNGKFDEHKVMIGFKSEEDAGKAYLSNYQKGWKGLKNIVPMEMDEFKKWAVSEGPSKGELVKTEDKGEPVKIERKAFTTSRASRIGTYLGGINNPASDERIRKWHNEHIFEDVPVKKKPPGPKIDQAERSREMEITGHLIREKELDPDVPRGAPSVELTAKDLPKTFTLYGTEYKRFRDNKVGSVTFNRADKPFSKHFELDKDEKIFIDGKVIQEEPPPNLEEPPPNPKFNVAKESNTAVQDISEMTPDEKMQLFRILDREKKRLSDVKKKLSDTNKRLSKDDNVRRVVLGTQHKYSVEKSGSENVTYNKEENVHSIKEFSKGVLEKISPALQAKLKIHMSEYYKYGNGKPKIKKFVGNQQGLFWMDRRGNQAHVFINPNIKIEDMKSTIIHEILSHYGAEAVMSSNSKINSQISALFKADQGSAFMEDIDARWKDEFSKITDNDSREAARRSEWVAERIRTYVEGIDVKQQEMNIAKRVYHSLRNFIVDTFKISTGKADDIIRRIVKEMKTASPVKASDTARFSKAPLTEKPKVSEDIYERNRETANKKIKPSIVSKIANSIEKNITPISDRLQNIDQSLKNSMRNHEERVLKKRYEYEDAVMPFLKLKKKKMSKDDFKDFDYAEANIDINKIQELVTKYGLDKEYKAKRDALDDIYKSAIEIGYDVNYLEDMSPRRVSNYEGLITHLKGTENWSKFQNAINQETERINKKLADEGKPPRDITTNEILSVIDKMLRGYTQDKVGLRKPKQLKGRTIKFIDPESYQYYDNSDKSLMSYIQNVSNAIETKRFFGNSAILTDDGHLDIEESIARYTALLLAQKKINYKDEQNIQNMLMSRFNPGNMGELFSLFKNIEYAELLGSGISPAITQIKDLSFTYYNTDLLNTISSFFGKKNIKMEDIYLREISQEFSETSRSTKAINLILKPIFGRLDRLGKETFINSEYKKMRSLAKNKPKKALEKLRPVFGAHAYLALQDIKSGNITGRVKTHLFNKILDYQPLTPSETSEGYNKAGNTKILWFLKTFQLRQLSAYRRETISLWNKGNKKQATKNFIKLSGALLALGAGVDLLKDFIKGKDTEWPDLLFNNILAITGFSRYFFIKLGDRPTEAISDILFPPFRIADSIFRDFKNLWFEKNKKLESVRSVPFIGEELLYWWLGPGRERTQQKRDKKYWEKLSDLRSTNKKLKKLRDKFKSAETKKDKLSLAREISEFRKEHSKELSYLKQAEGLRRKYNKATKMAEQMKTTKDQLKMEQLKEKYLHQFLRESDKLGI